MAEEVYSNDTGNVPAEGQIEGHLLEANEKGQELDEIKKRLKEMDEERAALLEMQNNIEKEMRESRWSQVDLSSVFVGNVEYGCTTEEILKHFGTCGTVHRVTVPTNKFRKPQGFAYVEFKEKEAVQAAIRLNGSLLHGRQVKVVAKRTNVPGMKQVPPRRCNPYVAAQRYRWPRLAPYMNAPSGYGKFNPNFRARPKHYS